MIYKRPKTRCSECPLSGMKHVYGVGKFQDKIAIYGEAPGGDEDRTGEPFIGKAGRLLTWGLVEAGIWRNRCFVSNVILCRPPNNDITSYEAQQAMDCCAIGFDMELKMLKANGVTTIITLGNAATHAFGIGGAITKVRGSVYESKGFTIVPTFHPSYLNRMGYSKKNARVDFKLTWVNDLKKARSVSLGYKPPKEKFIINPSVEQIEQFYNTAKKGKYSLGLDIETTSLRRDFAKVVCIGFAIDSERALCVPWLIKDHQSPWSNGSRAKVKELVNKLLQLPLILQNAIYDIPILKRNGFDAEFKNVEHDILLLHHIITPESPHNLGYIVSIHGQTPYWKGDFLDRGVSILDYPPKKLWTYNSRDCVVLHQVLPDLLAELELMGPKAKWVYENESLAMLPAISSMKDRGIKLSQSRLARYKKKLETQLVEIENNINKEFHLPTGFNLNSSLNIKWLLFGIPIPKVPTLEDLDAFNEYEEVTIKCNECKKPSWVRVDLDIHHCPKCSSNDIKLTDKTRMKSKRRAGTKVHDQELLLFEINKLTPLTQPPHWKPMRTDGGDISYDDECRLSMRIAIQNRLLDLKNMKRSTEEHELESSKLQRTLDFVTLFNSYQGTSKLISTYTDYPTWNDGRVHCDFLIAGTATGRLCVDPDTEVETPRDYTKPRLKLRELSKGDYVYSFDENRELCLRKVAWVGPTKVKETLIIHTDKGLPLTVSKDHLLRGWRGEWVCAKDIKIGDRLLCMPPVGDNGEGYHVVTRVEGGPTKQLWDLEVEETHCFIGNDIALHNSSKHPNLQNLPKKELDARKPFVAEEGYIFLSGDYSNLEVWVLAYVTEERVLQEILLSGKNVHDENTKLFGVQPNDPGWKLARRAAKIFQFALVQYGGTEQGIYKKVLMECPELQITFKEFKAIRVSYLRKYPSLASWQSYIQEYAIANRYIETFMGRRRRLLGPEYDIKKQALNCVDYQTEALTRTGWKNGLELKEGERILTKNIETGFLEWQQLNEVSNFPNSLTKCVEFSHPTMSAISTLDHGWMVYNKWHQKNMRKTTMELSDYGDDRIHRTGQYVQKETEYTDRFVQLIGWILTDGSIRKSTRGATTFNIYQSERANLENVREIDELIMELKIPNIRRVVPRTQSVTWECKGDIGKSVRSLFPERVLTYEFLTSISDQQCKLLLKTMLKGDGSRDKNGQHLRFVCSTQLKAEMFQTLVSLTGAHATYKYRDMSKYKPTSSKLENIPKMAGCWIVSIHKRDKTQILGKHKKGILQKGVWCPQVDNTYFVARRGGTIYISANTPIQGAAADVINCAIVRVHERLKETNSHLVLQIHDQLVVETRKDEVKKVALILKEEMEKEVIIKQRSVSLPVDLEIGDSLGTLKEYKGV